MSDPPFSLFFSIFFLQDGPPIEISIHDEHSVKCRLLNGDDDECGAGNKGEEDEDAAFARQEETPPPPPPGFPTSGETPRLTARAGDDVDDCSLAEEDEDEEAREYRCLSAVLVGKMAFDGNNVDRTAEEIFDGRYCGPKHETQM